MRKALKRELGRQKQAKNLAESIESGLKAQLQDKKARKHDISDHLTDLEQHNKKSRKNGASPKKENA